MRRLFLHIGGFKTGSTAIQAYLKAHREALAERGVLVPRAGADASGRHLPLVRALTAGGELPPRIAAAPAAFAAEVAAASDRDVVVSCEGLEVKLGEALPFFRSLGCELRVILYLRNQPQRLNSSYVQEARLLHVRHGFADHVARTLIGNVERPSSWLRRADLRPDEIAFRPYTGASRSDAVADFLAVLGLDAATLPGTAEVRRNVSVSAVGVAALRMLARLARTRGLTVPVGVRNEIIRRVEEADAALGAPPFQGLTPALFAHVVEQFAGDNAWFAHAVWDQPWTEVFAGDLHPPERVTEIDLDGATITAAREAQRIFRLIRPLFLASASRDETPEDPDVDLGPLLLHALSV